MKAKVPGFQLDGQPIVACVVLLARDAERLLALLRETLAASADSTSLDPPALLTVPPQTESEDAWLNHTEAAQYLGMSKSTLYRYVCEQRIECRKLGGRLEYCRSILDRFKKEQVRPARRSRTSGSIIKSALGSGK